MELSPDLLTLETHRQDVTSGRTPRILILEDDPALRRILWRTFAGWGWSAVTAATLDEAKLYASEKSSYNLIISDYHLPDGTGLEFMDWIVERGNPPPFILMSADARIPFRIQAKRLQKPFSIDELRSLVESTLLLKANQSRLD
ncbi:MAG: response regulator [Verrucomicrobiales bacterium]|nr:response regulator [Verrucomicrobiales bacterium]